MQASSIYNKLFSVFILMFTWIMFNPIIAANNILVVGNPCLEKMDKDKGKYDKERYIPICKIKTKNKGGNRVEKEVKMECKKMKDLDKYLNKKKKDEYYTPAVLYKRTVGGNGEEFSEADMLSLYICPDTGVAFDVQQSDQAFPISNDKLKELNRENYRKIKFDAKGMKAKTEDLCEKDRSLLCKVEYKIKYKKNKLDDLKFKIEAKCEKDKDIKKRAGVQDIKDNSKEYKIKVYYAARKFSSADDKSGVTCLPPGYYKRVANECFNDSFCSNGEKCNRQTQRCVQCMGPNDCSDGQVCNSQNQCEVAVNCDNNIYRKTAYQGQCVECTSSEYCKQNYKGGRGKCNSSGICTNDRTARECDHKEPVIVSDNKGKAKGKAKSKSKGKSKLCSPYPTDAGQDCSVYNQGKNKYSETKCKNTDDERACCLPFRD